MVYTNFKSYAINNQDACNLTCSHLGAIRRMTVNHVRRGPEQH